MLVQYAIFIYWNNNTEHQDNGVGFFFVLYICIDLIHQYDTGNLLTVPLFGAGYQKFLRIKRIYLHL